MKKPVMVIMLPTKDKTNIFKRPSDGALIYKYTQKCNNSFVNLEGVYLYITVSQDVELIKEGDWFYVSGGLGAAIGIYQAKKNEPNNIWRHKIIATTDPNLLKEHDDTVPFPKMRSTGIAELPQSFLEEYCKNPNAEWKVEYQKKNGLELKLNQDNTVNITSVVKKMYSKEDVESILFQYAEDEHAWFSSKSEIDSFNNWIKDNLK